MRHLIVALSILLGSATSAHAQVSVGVDIGIHVPVYPRLVQVPGYPVYYDPYASTNYFFYDGAYWVYQGDTWFVSSWFDGPWQPVAPEYVPLFVLRVPVRYYRAPPPYFRGWHADRAPRWGKHWGRDWERRRPGWNRWDRRNVPRPAPLPVYQRRYAGDRYPRALEQQHSIRSEHYRYRPRETVTRERFPFGGPRVEPGRQAPDRRSPAQPRNEERWDERQAPDRRSPDRRQQRDEERWDERHEHGHGRR